MSNVDDELDEEELDDEELDEDELMRMTVTSCFLINSRPA
jgi:hypothetical protein